MNYNAERWLDDVTIDMRRKYPEDEVEIVPTRYGCEVWVGGMLEHEFDYAVAGEEERVRL